MRRRVWAGARTSPATTAAPMRTEVAAEAIAQLPPDSRRAVSAAHGLFAELSRRLRRTPAAQIRRTRIRVPDARKAVIILRALGGRP